MAWKHLWNGRKKSAAVSQKRKLNQGSDFLCELDQKSIQYHSQTGYEKDN